MVINMNDIEIILESLSIEQYKKFFNDKPLFTKAIKNKKNEYIEYLSHSNQNLKGIISILIENNVCITNCKFVNKNIIIQFLISKNDLNFIKYIKSKDPNLVIKLSPNDNNSYIVDFNMQSENQLINFKNVIANYLLVNKISKKTDESLLYFIKNQYGGVNEEYLKYIEVVNKSEIEYLVEKRRQETFQFEGTSEFIKSLENEHLIEDIFEQTGGYFNIPFNKLNHDMVYTMCNKYFEGIFKYRLNELFNKLISKNNVPFSICYNKQQQIDIGNYGISGNLPPFDKKFNIMVYINGNLDFCNIKGNKAVLNENLLGQIMITILHEYEHIMQRIGNVDARLKASIDNFELKCKNDENYYINNYCDDPAEIDANLKSFIYFNNIASMFGISKPEQIIMNKVKNVFNKSEESFNLYKNININDINDIFEKLSDNLESSIINNYEYKEVRR